MSAPAPTPAQPPTALQAALARAARTALGKAAPAEATEPAPAPAAPTAPRSARRAGLADKKAAAKAAMRPLRHAPADPAATPSPAPPRRRAPPAPRRAGERITQLHAEHYAAAAGFGAVFETKVAQELAAFCQGFTPGRDGLWLLVCQGRIEGSIAIDGQHGLCGGAHLRWFITSSRVRGLGGGRQMLARALAFVDGDLCEAGAIGGTDGARAGKGLPASDRHIDEGG